jgi:S1-C subfamily serine protease
MERAFRVSLPCRSVAASRRAAGGPRPALRAARLAAGRVVALAVGWAILPGWLSAVPAADVAPAVLEAQRQRIDVIRQASATAVAIFAGDAGGGSGVLISPDGYALTNFHVVQPAGPAMKCGLSDGRVYDAVLVGLDPTGDVALIKLLGREYFPFAELADSDEVEVGDFCFAAGNPFLLATDFQPSISVGIVSGVHRYQFPAGTILEYADCLQVDAAINPGNSGGGLFDARGRVIGVNGRASFEKRGRVNVGVGYAISSNQLRHFLGMLKGGRLVDHATLGATVATSADGRVVVSDILDSSDAWRRGLRYDDEIVSLAGRSVRTANAFKNILGTLPAGWRVPLVYRRGGRREEILVRLAGVHAAAELAAIVEGKDPRRPGRTPAPRDGGKPPGPPGEDGRDGPDGPPQEGSAGRPAALPDAIRDLYEPRRGYTNHRFNALERSRVMRLVSGGLAGAFAGRWTLSGRLADGEAFRIELSDTEGVIDLPTGTTRVDATGQLDANPSPPGSGGMLAALLLWRRLLVSPGDGSAATLGRTSYWGTAPLDPASFGRAGGQRLVDVLESSVAGVESRFAVAETGAVVGVDLWTSPDADPCEVRFTAVLPDHPQGMPAVIEVRHGNELFGVFRVESAVLEVEDAAARPDAGNRVPPGGGT